MKGKKKMSKLNKNIMMESALVNLVRETLFTLANASAIPPFLGTKDFVKTFPNLKPFVKRCKPWGNTVDFFLDWCVKSVIQNTHLYFAYDNRVHHFDIIDPCSPQYGKNFKIGRRMVACCGNFKIVQHRVEIED